MQDQTPAAAPPPRPPRRKAAPAPPGRNGRIAPKRPKPEEIVAGIRLAAMERRRESLQRALVQGGAALAVCAVVVLAILYLPGYVQSLQRPLQRTPAPAIDNVSAADQTEPAAVPSGQSSRKAPSMAALPAPPPQPSQQGAGQHTRAAARLNTAEAPIALKPAAIASHAVRSGHTVHSGARAAHYIGHHVPRRYAVESSTVRHGAGRSAAIPLRVAGKPSLNGSHPGVADSPKAPARKSAAATGGNGYSNRVNNVLDSFAH
ncbi:MAG TPA: hypothetical protein VGS41_13765 [Chthonomonadales bacterium]|nr:hypothetical protein [Chthonomonadales bacterium]